MRILLVAHYASERHGGEALIPVQLLRQLLRAGHEVWLLTHDSCRDDLAGLPEAHQVRLCRGTPGLGPVFTVGRRLPAALRQGAWAITQIERQLAMVPVVRRLVDELGIQIVHQPISVSPSIPSPIRSLPVPVVMGPLNGGMDLPPGFRGRDSVVGRIRKRSRPLLSAVLHSLLRGRREAAAILVANDRTRARLPAASRPQRIETVSDIGVDLTAWPEPSAAEVPAGRVRVCFAGRLVAWKGVDLLLDAFAEAVHCGPPAVELSLLIVGDGPCRDELAAQAQRLGVAGLVEFTGWQDRDGVLAALGDSDVFVLPSLEEAGGAVVLEAMACGLPVIAAAWGGPSYLLDDSCGIRVEPLERGQYVAGLHAAIVRLAADPALRGRLGAAGRARVEAHYDWARIAADVLGVYERVLADAARPPAGPGRAGAGRADGRAGQPG